MPSTTPIESATGTGKAPRHFSRATSSRRVLWSPPDDPEKPACPYRNGFEVEIMPHNPPPPFGNPFYGGGAWLDENHLDLRSVTQTEAVMAYPSLEPQNIQPLAGPPTAAATLTVLKTLAVEDGRGPQLVVCLVTPKTHSDGLPQQPFEAVAKIFDPLYYSFANRIATYQPDNVVWRAQVDYTCEAAAYNHLHRAGLTGDVAPDYFGSWTFTLPIIRASKTLQRPVRLVLMEHIKGPSILKVCHDPKALSRYAEEDRLEIFAQVLDAKVRQLHAGLDQRDLASRNVVLRPRESSSKGSKSLLPQPVIVDYNTAVVYELCLPDKRPRQQRAKLPKNPMQVFWNVSFADFEGWLPSSWEGDARRKQQWLKERFGGKTGSKYAPLSSELILAK